MLFFSRHSQAQSGTFRTATLGTPRPDNCTITTMDSRGCCDSSQPAVSRYANTFVKVRWSAGRVRSLLVVASGTTGWNGSVMPCGNPEPALFLSLALGYVVRPCRGTAAVPDRPRGRVLRC